jgi:hypothetical protein
MGWRRSAENKRREEKEPNLKKTKENAHVGQGCATHMTGLKVHS